MQTSSSERGFTLVELMVASMLTLVVVGVSLTTFANALRLNDMVTNLADSSQNLRAGTNLLVRDLLQAGRNIPTGGIPIPSGTGSVGIHRPSPPLLDYTFDNVTNPNIEAITTGEAKGPKIGGKWTDMVTILMDDSVLGDLPLKPCTPGGTAPDPMVNCDGGASFTVNSRLDWLQGSPTDGIPAIQKGDLILFTGPNGDAMQVVTKITSPTIYFESGSADPFTLNQRGAQSGSITQILGPMSARRIYMYTYYVHADTAGLPRLMRAVNMFPPQALAGVIEELTLSFDLVDGVVNPINIKTLPYVYSPSKTFSASQARKANVHVGVRSETKSREADYVRNDLSTVVSLRNLAYVDRYK